MSWSDAARRAALEARRRKGKAPKIGTAASKRRIEIARGIRETRANLRKSGFKVLGLSGYNRVVSTGHSAGRLGWTVPAAGNTISRSRQSKAEADVQFGRNRKKKNSARRLAASMAVYRKMTYGR